MQLSLDVITVGARASPLAQVQVAEVLADLRQHHPDIEFEVEAITTFGDRDQETSLRRLGKTDFFTKEIDAQLLEKKIRIAVHSAKDLPEPLPEGITIAAITKGIDPSDSLVLRPGETLKHNALIATSSERREEAVKTLRSDLRFCDLRGTIQQRLDKLDAGEVDGIVVAEAALIRLSLTHLNRIRLPGETTPLQGKLAILVREDDDEMKKLFSSIDTRQRCLYLGLELPDGQ